MLKVLLKFIVPVLLTSTKLLRGEEVSQEQIDFYVDYINNHTEKALKYKLPNDARMYEAENKFPQGKSLLFECSKKPFYF